VPRDGAVSANYMHCALRGGESCAPEILSGLLSDDYVTGVFSSHKIFRVPEWPHDRVVSVGGDPLIMLAHTLDWLTMAQYDIISMLWRSPQETVLT